MIELHSHLGLDALYFCLDSLILENSTVLRNKHRLWSHLSARRLWRNHLPFLSSSFHISQSGNNPHLTQSLWRWNDTGEEPCMCWSLLLFPQPAVITRTVTFQSLDSEGRGEADYCLLACCFIYLQTNKACSSALMGRKSFQAQGLNL